MRRRRMGSTVALALAAVAVTQATQPRPRLLAVADTTCADATYQRLQTAETEADRRASRYTSYAGIALASPCGPIDVYATDTSDAFRRSVVGDLDASEFAFHTVAHSFTQMLAVQDQVTARLASLRDLGLDVVMYWPDMTTGYETIQVRAASAAQLDAVSRLFDGTVRVQVVPDAPVIQTTDRLADTPPFNSGDFIFTINSSFVGDCTGGPNAHTGSGLTESYFMLTAGHCSQNASHQAVTGTTWNNGYFDGSPHGSQVVVGNVTQNLWNSHYDVAVISVPAHTSINMWTGASPGTSLYNIVSGQSALVGQEVCNNGAFEGTRCGAIVQSTGYKGCINLALAAGGPQTSECGEIHAVATSVIGGEGDSGGPLYINIQGPGLTMGGIISAESAQNLACPAYTWRGNVCAKDVYFVDLPTALAQAAVTLNSNTTGG